MKLRAQEMSKAKDGLLAVRRSSAGALRVGLHELGDAALKKDKQNENEIKMN